MIPENLEQILILLHRYGVVSYKDSNLELTRQIIVDNPIRNDIPLSRNDIEKAINDIGSDIEKAINDIGSDSEAANYAQNVIEDLEDENLLISDPEEFERRMNNV